MFCLKSMTAAMLRSALAIWLLSAVSACGGGGSDNAPPAQSPPTGNSSPTVNAGPDQSVNEGVTVQLVGMGSDAESAVTFAWTQLSGPTVTLSNASIAAPTFVAPMVMTTVIVVLRLAVSDAAGATVTDDVSITINDVPPANTPPTVNAGPDQTVNEDATVQLAGSGSDAEGAVTLQWTQVSGPTVTLSNTTVGNPTFTAPQVTSASSIVLRLTATDSADATAQDTVTITVNDSVVSGSGWGTATLIENNADGANSPEVIFDSAGNAVAVWRQWNGTNHVLWANRYVAGVGWETATLIEANAGSVGVYYPSQQLAVDGVGNVMVVWERHDGTRRDIFAKRYAVGGDWGTSTSLETNASDATYPKVAMDTAGNAFAVWTQSDGTYQSIWTNRYVAGLGWGIATLIESNAGTAVSPQVAMDAAGNAMAVWRQTVVTGYLRIWASRYQAGTGWSTPTIIETNATGGGQPEVAVDNSGNAVAVWTQSDGTRSNLWANRYVAGVGWGTATLIENHANNVVDPKVAMDTAGNAVAVWQESGSSNIWANRYAAGTGWDTATLIETNVATAGYPDVAIDTAGNALAVWQQHDGAFQSIWANRYVAGTGWGTATLIETNAGHAYSSPQVAVDSVGNAIAVWEQLDVTGATLTYSIWANRFTR